jgi:glycosyltransferase involved in cell wall biosynthesis
LKNILFITHDSKRAGAPLLLFNFLKLLKSNANFTFTIISKDGGELIKEFKTIANTYVWNDSKKSFESDTLNHFANKLNIEGSISNYNKSKNQKNIITNLKNQTFDLVLINTITNGDLLKELTFINCPIISYIHEMALAFQLFTTKENYSFQLSKTDYYLVPSMAVKENLINNHNIEANKIEILSTIIAEYKKSLKSKIELLKSNSIAENKLIIGSVGTLDTRKGPDLFLQVANLVNKILKDKIQFIWLGADLDTLDTKVLLNDVKKLHLDSVVSILGPSNSPVDYFELFDIFLLTSREDPYPLVVLEAAMASKPIICFDKNAGGAADFVADDCGFVVDYFDINAMAEKIINLYNDEKLRQQLGQNAKNKVLKNHNIELGYSQFVNILEKFTK